MPRRIDHPDGSHTLIYDEGWEKKPVFMPAPKQEPAPKKDEPKKYGDKVGGG
jgi:hypothetical protein